MIFWFLWFYVQELPKALLAVVLVLKRLRRRVHGLKSHPTDWEKPGIEPATPGLQDIGLSPKPRRLLVYHTLYGICTQDLYSFKRGHYYKRKSNFDLNVSVTLYFLGKGVIKRVLI